jgi:hypothetical protein
MAPFSPSSPFLFLPLLSVEAIALPDKNWSISNPANLQLRLQELLRSVPQLYPQASQGKFDAWEMAQLAAVCSLLPGIWYLRGRWMGSKSMSWASSEPAIEGVTRDPSVRNSVDVNGESTLLISAERR